MALSLGSNAAAPTPITDGRKARKAKTFEEQVQAADLEPFRPVSDLPEETDEQTDAVKEFLQDEDRTETLAEFLQRNQRMGLGAAQEAPESPRTFVTDYDAKGEAIDVPVPPRAPQQPPTTATGNQYVMPMFEGLTMDAVVINLAGRVELNYASTRDRNIWDALRLGEDVELVLTGKVVGRKNAVALDKEREVKAASATASVKIFELAAADDLPSTRTKYVVVDPAANVQALVNWAHQILVDEANWDDTNEANYDTLVAFIRGVADLAEPTGSDSAPSDEEPKPEPTALDDALAAALEGDDEAAE